MAKACTFTTNFLNFCRTGSAIDVDFMVGVLGVDCVAGVGKMYTWSVEGATGSGQLVAWAVALGFNLGIGRMIGSWVPSTVSYPLLSSVNNGEVASFFSHRQTAAPTKDSKFTTRPSCGCCRHGSSTMVPLRHSSS